MWCAQYISIMKCTPTNQSVSVPGSGWELHTSHSSVGLVRRLSKGTFAADWNKKLKTCLFENNLSTCSLSIENIELIRSGLTQISNYFCCPHTRAKVGIAQNKDSALYWLKEGAGGSANPADLPWQVRLTNFDWTQRGWARPILPKKSLRSSNKLLNFMLVFFLKDLAPGSMRLNKNESFHFKETSF